MRGHFGQLAEAGVLGGAAEQAGLLLLPEAPYRGLKRVIDVSGDGSNNRGRDVREARDEAVRAGVVINGLPIVSLEYDLDKYYFNNVIGGPGAVRCRARFPPSPAPRPLAIGGPLRRSDQSKSYDREFPARPGRSPRQL